ncbi:CS1 type fimbrial major subunit [uncultured Pseudomonas sp.]|uniref:CS1 type fimbrial major subunit n=1 Tax=uncultured Pseudomonas sp. TaxID=114707 RepID=UPI0025CE2619|nr:CS1 type fimbrial major subunit [uncultured Pseudomonas sp.]
MFKTSVIAASLAVSLLGAGSVFAAGEASTNISITATVFKDDFRVQPINDDFGRNETMTHNTSTNKLSTVGSRYNVKNTAGSIHAYVEGGSPSLTNGSTAIPMTVLFNNVTLTGAPQEVVSDAASTPGTQVDLLVRADDPTENDVGDFTSNFVVMFDSVVRPVTP